VVIVRVEDLTGLAPHGRPLGQRDRRLTVDLEPLLAPPQGESEQWA
jgi:hypothetical protein